MTSRETRNYYNSINQCDILRFCKCPDIIKSKLKPLKETSKYCKKDLNSTIKKLTELISDPVCSIDTQRICYYLEDFFNLNGNEGFYVKDLDSIMCILEFLALRIQSFPEYQNHLDHMLDLCCTPPLLTKTSEGLYCSEILEHYFTLFGYLLLILPTIREVLIVHRAIHQLLERKKPAHIAAVRLEICHRAVETSILPIIITDILEIGMDEVFPRILETAFLLVSTSRKCCYRMIEAGLFEYILIRLDPNYAIRGNLKPQEDIPEEELTGDHNQFEILVLVTNIMWKSLNSIMELDNSPEYLSRFKPPSQSAMRSLRYAFKKEVRCAGRNQTSLIMRNDLAAIMLAILANLPGWRFVESGLADDFAILAVASEIETDYNSWSSGIRFGTSNEDHRFKKILILIMCHLAKISASIEIMKRRRFLASLMILINPNANEINSLRNESQFWDLHQYALYALSILQPLMPEDFIKNQGTIRLQMILEWNMANDFDSELILNCIKTIDSIIITSDDITQKDFRNQGIVGTVIKLFRFVLSLNLLNSQHQRILTHSILILYHLIKDEKLYQAMYGEQSVKMVLEILQKCSNDRRRNFELDNRLGIAVGSYIWKCIVWCPANLKMFVERGGIFLILDGIDSTIFPVRIIFLGTICDICDLEECETQISTWRGGEDKNIGLISLLARIWREEEIRIKSKRDENGCISDLELPLMGAVQQFDTFHSTKRDHTISPSLSDMIGSCRPKIYGIRKIIERNYERYELAKNHYKILLEEIPKEDKITMVIIDNYFRLKQGEIWIEIHRAMQRIGITPLRIEGEMIFLMLRSYRRLSLFVQSKQENILKEIREAEIRDEIATYKEIIDSKLAPTLEAFHQIDYISRTTNREFMLRSKERQRTQVDAAYNIFGNLNPQFCHRTFLRNSNVTAIMNHQHIIQSEIVGDNIESSEFKLMPVSPPISGFTTASLKSNVEAAGINALSCRACFATGLPCFHH